MLVHGYESHQADITSATIGHLLLEAAFSISCATTDAVVFDLRWKIACGFPPGLRGFPSFDPDLLATQDRRGCPPEPDLRRRGPGHYYHWHLVG